MTKLIIDFEWPVAKSYSYEPPDKSPARTHTLADSGERFGFLIATGPTVLRRPLDGQGAFLKILLSGRPLREIVLKAASTYGMLTCPSGEGQSEPAGLWKGLIDELKQLLDRKQRSEAALKQFKTTLSRLVSGSPASGPVSPDSLEQRGVLASDDDWRKVFDALADQEPADDSSGGAAGLGDQFKRLWNGAKAALRVTTYWQMKDRAGIVGRTGLGPLIIRLQEAIPDIRVHLLGHSFGARLVSYSLSVLPESGSSPVKSLFLLQGAFSHFTFAEALPFDKKRKGDLVGMASKVDGPLLTTHSLKDLAVGTAYPLASIVAGQDAADQTDTLFRWGAMGHDGAQAVDAKQAQLSKPGTVYPVEVGKWTNLDGNKVIINGGPPSGAHSDIVHPHTAWASLAAAGIV